MRFPVLGFHSNDPEFLLVGSFMAKVVSGVQPSSDVSASQPLFPLSLEMVVRRRNSKSDGGIPARRNSKHPYQTEEFQPVGQIWVELNSGFTEWVKGEGGKKTMPKRVSMGRNQNDLLLTRSVTSVFNFVRFAEFEILFVLFFVVAFIIFKDLTATPEYNQILVKIGGLTRQVYGET
ncbi:hypothetical protein C3L33_09597, partial [Rhododendron williamsianum]